MQCGRGFSKSGQVNRRINREIEEEKRRITLRFLLMGTSGSGKSTIIKQLLQQSYGFNQNDKCPSVEQFHFPNPQVSIEAQFQMSKTNVHILDIRQDKFRKLHNKFHFFHDLSDMLFVVDCSSYDVDLGLQDSLILFRHAVNNSSFPNYNIFLLLNKQDVLAAKVREGSSRLEQYFPEFVNYSVPDDVLSNGNVRFHQYFTCAWSTESVNTAFKNCEAIAYESALYHRKCMRSSSCEII
jgi:hypothetical protein